MITIEEIDAVHSQISDWKAIKDFLGYRAEYWRPGRYRKERHNYFRSLVKKDGVFYSGFLPRVRKHLKGGGVEYHVGKSEGNHINKEPSLPGIKFRKDQLDALNVMKMGRGVWQAPTGSGKTILIAGLLSMSDWRALVIVHTETLFRQTIEELERFWPGEVGSLGCGMDDERDITVAMIQTLSRGKGDLDGYGMVIVDEAHHVSRFGGSYDRVLRGMGGAHLRFGFTATLSEREEAKLAMEGLLGPVLGETTYEELQGEEVLSKPRMRLLWVPESNLKERIDRLKAEKRKLGERVAYKDIYELGIVFNRKRNGLIVGEAKRLLGMGLTVLIMVERVEHGRELLKMAETVMPGEFVFLHGNTDAEIKAEEKRLFTDKERKGVIATRIWSEGVNIRSMGAVINAVGGLSEIGVLQRFGRGLRTDEGKTEVWLIDMMDTNHQWFQKHSMKRLCLYFEMNWIGE